MTAPGVPGPEHLSDIEALRGLSAAYAAAVDDRDGDRLASLFLDSGELLLPEGPGHARPMISRVGPASLRQVPEGLRRYERTFHQVSNHRFVIEGDRATGEVQCVAHHVMAAPPDQVGSDHRAGTDTVWFIRYVDAYLRTGRGWRFERRALYLQWVTEHRVSVLPADPGADHC